MFIEQRKQCEAKSQRESYKSRWRGEAGNVVSSCLRVRKMRPGHGYCSEDEDGFECRKGRKLINPETSALSFEANRTDWTGAREKKEGLKWRMKRGDEEEDGSRDEEKSRGTWTGAGLWGLGTRGRGGHALHTSHRHVVGAANTLVPTAFSWAAVRCGGWIGGPPHHTGGQGTRWSPCLELQTPGRTRVPHLLRQVDVSNGTCTLDMSKLLGQHVP